MGKNLERDIAPPGEELVHIDTVRHPWLEKTKTALMPFWYALKPLTTGLITCFKGFILGVKYSFGLIMTPIATYRKLARVLNSREDSTAIACIIVPHVSITASLLMYGFNDGQSIQWCRWLIYLMALCVSINGLYELGRWQMNKEKAK